MGIDTGIDNGTASENDTYTYNVVVAILETESMAGDMTTETIDDMHGTDTDNESGYVCKWNMEHACIGQVLS